MSDKKNLNISLQSGKNKDVNKILAAWEGRKDPISTLVCEYIVYGYILDNCTSTKGYVDAIRYNIEKLEDKSKGIEKFNEEFLKEFDKILSNNEIGTPIVTKDVNWEIQYNKLCKYLIENHKDVAIEVMKNIL